MVRSCRKHEDAAAVWFLENEAKPRNCFCFIRPKIVFLAEKLAEQTGQLIQILENGRLDNDFAHVASLFHKAGRAVAILLLIMICLVRRNPPSGKTKQELTERHDP